MVGPIAPDGSEHVAAHDRCTQSLLASGGETIINALGAAILPKNLVERAGSERPVVELVAASTKRVVEALVGSRGIAID